jgi:NhaP-type Na+/H+ and K+/H+ antiporter
MLVSRGEFELILASLAVAAGLDSRVAPFAALYVLVLSILSPLFSAKSFVLAGWLPARLFAHGADDETAPEPGRSEPIIEVGAIRRLGAETIEYPVHRDDAVAGAHVRDLALPRDALVSVIVRAHEAIAPRGSTRLRPGDPRRPCARRRSGCPRARARPQRRCAPARSP